MRAETEHTNKNKTELQKRSATMKKQQWKRRHLKPKQKKRLKTNKQTEPGTSGTKTCLIGVVGGGAQDI